MFFSLKQKQALASLCKEVEDPDSNLNALATVTEGTDNENSK